MKQKIFCILLMLVLFTGFATTCSAEQDVSQATIETIILISGLLFVFMGVMMLRFEPALWIMAIFLLGLGIFFIVAVLTGNIQPTV